MSALTSALPSSSWVAECETSARRPVIMRVARGAILGCLLSLAFVIEYEQAGSIASKNLLYDTLASGFRIIDVLVLGLAIVYGFSLGCLRKRSRRFPPTLIALLTAFAGAIVVSLVYGIERGGKNFFFDWRALALGVAFYVIYRFWIQSASDARAAIIAFAVVVSVRMAALFFFYLRGEGDSLLGVRIPLFDGPSISALVFASLLGLSLFAEGYSTRLKWLWLMFSAGATLLVALGFRRTYWAEFAFGIVLLTVASHGRRLRILALPLCMAAVAFAALGSAFTERLSSLNFTRDDVPYSEDNSDHVGDVLDAWSEIRASPLMGIGLGTAYPTWHIRNWKEESVMVHNAPLHVWLKYGLAGLTLYLAYHVALFRCLRRHGKRSPPQHRAIVNAVLAYLAAQFIVSLGFTPWPYSAVQSTNLIAFLLAIAFV